MKPEEQIKSLAELDGIFLDEWRPENRKHFKIPYLTSYDAIIPLIKKQDYNVKAAIYNFFTREDAGWTTCAVSMLEATPDELCEALLRATENWKE